MAAKPRKAVQLTRQRSLTASSFRLDICRARGWEDHQPAICRAGSRLGLDYCLSAWTDKARAVWRGPNRSGETSWRVNFNRVHWQHRVINNGTRHEREPPHGTPLPQGPAEWHPEKNWVWALQRAVNMYAPETWGYADIVQNLHRSHLLLSLYSVSAKIVDCY
jgi:hypothetical protein